MITKAINYFLTAGIAFAMILFSGCKEFLDINEDPNNPTDIPLNQLLPTVQVDIAGAFGNSVGGLSAETSFMMHQFLLRGPEQDYNITGSDFAILTPWDILYARAFTDIREIVRKGTEEESWHYVGVAQLLKAYATSVMVDLWGDIPFTEANKGAELRFPRYDDDAEIYDSLFLLIDAGIANLQRESTLSPDRDDLFYNGNTDLWIKFANTLKLKMYNQIRLVEDVSAEVQALVNGSLIDTLAEDFEFQYGSSVSPDNRNPGYTQEYAPGGAWYYINPYFYEIMSGQNTFYEDDKNIYDGIVDPRLPYYFYNQLAPGQAPENPPAYQNGRFLSIHMFSYNIDPREGFGQSASQTVAGLYPLGGRYDNGQGGPSNFNGAADTPQRFLTYYQRRFIEAELAWAGLIPGDPAELFESAMRAAFAKVNEVAANASAPVITAAAIDTYVNSIMTLYDAANNNGKLQHIMTQKWIANFGYSIDAYTDYRRTGYPLLHDGNTDDLEVTVRTRDFPLSLPYKTDDLQINPNAPNQKAITTSRVFWDVN